MEEKRDSSRHRTFKGGTISFDRGLVDCALVKTGERDPDRLCAGALAALGNIRQQAI